MLEKSRELLEEFRTVVGKVGLLDTILPPILFLLLNGLAGFNAAMVGALGLAVLIAATASAAGSPCCTRWRGWEALGWRLRWRFCSDVRRDSSSQASSTAD